ncbi:ribosomal RNA-processing protein 7 homolog A-like [Elysia marginata]|uniref:Ribosomal RNA-processing protein 7 homolog A-like n=1 Tax=Elysia marginata TaxID=1093978 RepID=A0AAV4EJI0_9GAST|nr:ribosomal RNA-processing protein 7 homolog A-like [Elysia marginata]
MDIGSYLVIQGYSVIQVKASERSRACRFLYLKEHKSTHQTVEWPQGRTLEIHNIPPYCTQDNLRKILNGCGEIVRIYLQPKYTSMPLKASLTLSSEANPKNVSVAYVVFRKANGVKNACSLAYDTERLMSDKDTPLISGLRAYIKEYKDIPDIKAMEEKAETYLAEYYKRKDEEVQQEKDMEGIPDEDGFIKVTRHGKNKGSRRTEENERKAKEKMRLKKKKTELKDFYTSQFRETKRKHILELQAKFEEDKKKIKEMKAARKFRPY